MGPMQRPPGRWYGLGERGFGGHGQEQGRRQAQGVAQYKGIRPLCNRGGYELGGVGGRGERSGAREEGGTGSSPV